MSIQYQRRLGILTVFPERDADVWKEVAWCEPCPNLHDVCFPPPLTGNNLAGNRHSTSTGLQPIFVWGHLGTRHNYRWPKIWDVQCQLLYPRPPFFLQLPHSTSHLPGSYLERIKKLLLELGHHLMLRGVPCKSPPTSQVLKLHCG